MRIGVIAVAVGLLVGAATADPFTGRYNVKSVPDGAVSMAGYIDFTAAPMGTDEFRLGDAFVSGFSLVVSGGGFNTITYNSLTQSWKDDDIKFSASLGSSELLPIPPSVGRRSWSARGDLGGPAANPPYINDVLGLTTATLNPSGDLQRDWFAGSYLVIPNIGIDQNNAFSETRTPTTAAWKLVRDDPGTAPVPEPGTLVMFGAAAAGAYVWRRRTRNAC